MTVLIGAQCANCGAELAGTKFCENCGAPAPIRAASVQAPAAVARPGISIATALRAATMVFLLSAAIVPAGFSVAVSSYANSVIGQYGYIADGSGAIRILAGLLAIFAGAASTWAALVSPVAISRKVGGAILSTVGGSLIALAGFGVAGGVWSGSAGYLVGLIFFSAWALTRPIAGLGFVVIPIFLGVSVILTLIPTGYLPSAAASAVNGVLAALVLAAGAWAAIALERRRAVARGITFDAFAGAQVWPTSARPSTAATYSLIFSVLGFGLPGLIFGHVALSRLQRSGESGRGLAIAGLVLGYLSVLAVVVYLIFFAATLAIAYGTLFNYPLGY